MRKILDILTGKKTYIVAFLIALVQLLEAFGVIMPGWLTPLLASLGIVTMRQAITTEAVKAADAVASRQ